jgi:threonine dehydratase
VDEMLTVSDGELLGAMFYLWEKLHVLVEPTGSLAACAILERKVSFPGGRVGVVLSGGNVDLKWAAENLLRRS